MYHIIILLNLNYNKSIWFLLLILRKKEYHNIQNKDESLPFLGIVNYYFKREGYCLNTYLNEDKYFGYYNSDQRNKQGIYQFKPIKQGNKILYQYYYGLWKNDYFNGFGIYLWLYEEIGKIIKFRDESMTNFDMIITDKYTQVMSCFSTFNKISLCKDIETNIEFI